MGDIFAGSSFSPIGQVDADGKIRQSQFGPVLGRVENGVVHSSEWGHSPVGRIDNDGTVHGSEYGHQPVGRVDDSGQVFEQNGYQPIARVEAPHMQWSGAAYLLLLR